MGRKSDGHDRRFLSFPAVRPCERISPETLLNSILSLSRTVCRFRFTSLAPTRRYAREAIRQVEILVMFLEEVRGRGSLLQESGVLCLSELHVAFQKMKLLLEDCSREGARLWILINSLSVAAQFRLLIRAVATALDVLPLSRVDAADDVKEFVVLVAKQARRAKFEMDEAERAALDRVHTILRDFECKLLPERDVVKGFLEFLEIRSWTDCNEEVRFLEEQLALHCSDGDDRVVPLLSSLSAFMCYCRASMFETFEYKAAGDQRERNSDAVALDCLNPDDFRCPISLELMDDPVTVSTGQTYNRISIQKWLASGNLICPKTRERLPSDVLVPNLALRNLMQQFCGDRSISMYKSGKHKRNVERTAVAGSPAAAEAIRFLARFLTSTLVYGTPYQKNKAAYEIRLLAKSNIFHRSCLIEAHAIPPLLRLLASFDPSIQENAISAVLKLSKHSVGRRAIVESGGLRPIISVLKRNRLLECRQTAAAILFYLSSDEEFRTKIGGTASAIPALANLIKDGTPSGKKNAVVALFALLQSPENHRRIIDAGAVPLLLDLRSNSPAERPGLATDSLAVLASLAESFEGAISILENSGLPRITGVLCSAGASRTEREYCVSTLLSICVYGGNEAIGSLSANISVMAPLYTLLTEGSAHARMQARSVIRILQKYHETRGAPASPVPSSAAAPPVRPVHVR